MNLSRFYGEHEHLQTCLNRLSSDFPRVRSPLETVNKVSISLVCALCVHCIRFGAVKE